MNKNTSISDLPFFPKHAQINSEGYSLQFFAPKDLDIVLDSISDNEFNKDEFLPYWAHHWPSAEHFLAHILRYPFEKKISVCELGCGLGVLSSAFSMRQCDTYSIDISSQACKYSFQNIALNGGTPKVICSDWRHTGLNKKFDLIAASDVLYEARWIEPILTCINSLLAPGGKAWIADPCRRFWEPFKIQAKELGFSLKTLERKKTADNRLEIEILELSR